MKKEFTKKQIVQYLVGYFDNDGEFWASYEAVNKENAEMYRDVQQREFNNTLVVVKKTCNFETL